MEAPTVKSIDMDRVNELLKVADPYLKNYVRALRDVSSGWERLFHDSMKKVRELAAQDTMEICHTAPNSASMPFYKTVTKCSCGHKGYVNVCSKCGGLVD
jgi:hypothetical protein